MSKRKHYGLDEPLKLNDHPRPVTRREFLSQGFTTGMGAVLGGSMMSFFSKQSHALSSDLQAFFNADNGCTKISDSARIPFICFDLAGGANIAGSNVLVGRNTQTDVLSTAGYSKQGLPGDMLPGQVDPDGLGDGDFIDSTFNLKFHSHSQFLAGIREKVTSPDAIGRIDGAVIAARSENDTGNNPHNPMYAINRAGANGKLLALIGSRSSESGGNSMAPMSYIDPKVRPTKVDRPSDVVGLVDTGDLVNLLSQVDTVKVMEAVYRVSNAKLAAGDLSAVNVQETVENLVKCGYVKSADTAEEFGNPSALDPRLDAKIVGGTDSDGTFTPIFTQNELNDREFSKTASVMKLVLGGNAGAGTIAMGGYDYHTGDRVTGEARDLRAGRCMGACLEYAHRMGQPLMMYVFTDGSVFSNGMIDNAVGKGVWTGDSQQTSAAFFLVYNPNGTVQLINDDVGRRQIGFMRASGDVETTSSPAANNVNLLVDTIALNYMALHGDQGQFRTLFPNSGLAGFEDDLIVFQPIR